MTDEPSEAAVEAVGNILLNLDLFEDMNDLDTAAQRLTHAVWDLAVAHGREQAAAEYEPRLQRLRDYHPHGNCRTCSSKYGTPHSMYCKLYVGPLEHYWQSTRWNGTFGGIDHNCICGGWFRKGGSAGHGDGTEDAEAICPKADQDWRGPRSAAVTS